MGFPCSCCNPCSDKCNLLFEETVEQFFNQTGASMSAPTVEIDNYEFTSTFTWTMPSSPPTSGVRVVHTLVKLNHIPPQGWNACGYDITCRYTPISTVGDSYYPINVQGNLVFKKNGKFYLAPGNHSPNLTRSNGLGFGGANGNHVAQYFEELELPFDLMPLHFITTPTGTGVNLGSVDYQANGGLFGVNDSEAYFLFYTQIDTDQNHQYPEEIRIVVDHFCIHYLGGATDRKCTPRVFQLAPHERWFRGPLGVGSTSLGYSYIYFQRHYGSSKCNQRLILDFSHEEEDPDNGKTYRYYRSEQYETIDGNLAYAFARHDKCKTFINTWISTDSEAWQQPNDCSDNSNYLPIWDNGLEVDDDFDPLNPVNPIYIFGWDSSQVGSQANWQGRIFALNFPKRFYRYLDTIEIQNAENLFQSGDITLKYLYPFANPPGCGTVSGGYLEIGTADAGDWITPAYANIPRGHACFYDNSGTTTQLNSGGQWRVKVSAIPSPLTYIYDCPYTVEVNMNWLNDFNTSVITDDHENISFYLYFWSGSGFILGELLPTDPNGLTENWSTFENLTPITKSGGFGGGFSAAWQVDVVDLVLGSFEARGVYIDDF